MRFFLTWVLWAVVGVITLCSGLLYWRSWNPFMDDGPFRGATRFDCASLGRTPSQSYALEPGALESYDSPAKGESATVLLRRRDGTIAWCVYADGHERGDVAQIRFRDHRGGWVRDLTVRGEVQWTFGDEATRWKLDRDGQLKAYWYSW